MMDKLNAKLFEVNTRRYYKTNKLDDVSYDSYSVIAKDAKDAIEEAGKFINQKGEYVVEVKLITDNIDNI